MKRKVGAKYSNDQLMRAMQAVKDGSSQFAAARKYAIPRSTLFNKVSGKSQLGKKSGPGTALSTKEEEFIEKWVLCLADRGFPVVKWQLLRSIQLYLNASDRRSPFTNNLPGRKWYQNFLKRHPIITKRLSQNLIKSRASVTEVQLKSWHAEVRKYCEDNNLLEALNDPKRVFNMDEKGFILTPKNEVVLARKGQKAVYNRSENDDKECVTALLGGNAAGMKPPPMLVYPYKRTPKNIMLHLPPNWSVGISENGWQTQQTFFDYMKDVFCKWLSETEIELPVILFIDGHKSHISLTLSEFCSAQQIELIALYPNATHVIQPMDVVVFKPLGGSWDIKVKDWKIQHEYAKIDKKDIGPILNQSIESIDYAGLLQKGFERCGLFPFNVDNINMSRLVPVIPSAADSQDELFHDEDATESKPPENGQGALSRLKNFEEVIEPTYLNMFRSANDEWTGPIEYAAMYSIWKKLYADAAAFITSDDQGTMIIDVDTAESGTSAAPKSKNEHENNSMVFVVGDNGELLESGDTDFEIENNRIVIGESVGLGIGDMVVLGDDESIFSVSISDDPESMTVNQIACDLPEQGQIVDNHPMGINETQKLDAAACDETKDVALPTKNTKRQKAIPKLFDKEAFKKSFLMPQLKAGNKKKFVTNEKPSTVITSEAWKDAEKKKLEEKERQENEKVARKMAREQKKTITEQVKAEKIMAREKKKMEKSGKEAEKKAKKGGKEAEKKSKRVSKRKNL